MESATFSVVDVDDRPAVILDRIEAAETRTGYRRIVLRLPRRYDAGDLVAFAWKECLSFGPYPPDWGRYWAHVTALNDNFELQMTVTFSDGAQLPDLCWWFSAEPITDLGEIGPESLEHLADLQQSRTASHTWRPTETESRRQFGFMWVWLDDDEEARQRWNTARERLQGVEQ